MLPKKEIKSAGRGARQDNSERDATSFMPRESPDRSSSNLHHRLRGYHTALEATGTARLLRASFDDCPLKSQPDAVAVDCEDGGALALSIISFVHEHTHRGLHTASLPLLLIAQVASAEYGAVTVASLQAAGAPHVVVEHGAAVSSLVGVGRVLDLRTSLTVAGSGRVPVPVACPAVVLVPVVLSGAAGRRPFGVHTARQLSQLTSSGYSLVGEVPPCRWSLSDVPQAQHRPEWAEAARHMAYVLGAQLFEASLFRISATEACSMDPQQRLLLECAHETHSLPHTTYRCSSCTSAHT